MPTPAALPALDPDDSVRLFDCLKQSLSQDSLVQKSAEAALEQYERRPNFCACLAEILRSKQADHSVRWLAAVQFKNTITKRWRPKSGLGNLEDGEKEYLRGQILQLILEEDNQIAVQMAVVFAKIARFDYPKAWPGLFTDLLQQLQNQSTLVVRRVYLVLHHALKELASKRLSSDQKAFAELTKQLFEHVWSQWCFDSQQIASGLPQALANQTPGQPLLLSLERWLILLKALRRLVVFGFQSDSRTLEPVAVVTQTVPMLLQALQTLLAARPAKGAPRSQLAVMLDRGLIKLAKVITNVQEVHPWSFYYAGVFDGAMELFFSQLVSGQQPDGGLFDRFLIQCMLYHHAVLTCPSYKGTSGAFELTSAARSQNMSGAIKSLGTSGASHGIKSVADNVKQMSQGVKASMAAFWTPDRLHQLAQTLAYHFFTLTDRELEHWEESPEEFHHQSDSAAFRDNVRPCAELLFATLLQAYRAELAPAVVGMLAAASEACPPGAPSRMASQNGAASMSPAIPAAVLHKEAIYAAVGTGAYELHDFIDYQPWLRTTLVQEIADQSPAARPLRRRAGLLVGQWVGKLKGEDRPLAYRALLSLLADPDPAMQLAAVASLHALIDDWEFREDQFLDLVGPCFQLLANFMQSAVDFDSQLQIFGLMNLIIDRLGDSVKPFAEGLLRLLPEIWQDAEGQSLLRIQVLLALQRLVNALGMDSPASYTLLLPILQQCTSIHQPDELNLLEDGLQLWLIALRNAPAPHASLLDLFSNLATVMERSTEHVQMACQIITSCVLLGRASFLQHYGGTVVRSLQALIGNVNERGMLLLFTTLEIILQCFPGEGPSLLQPALQRLLVMVLGDKESGLTVSNAVTVYARTLLQMPQWFLQFCDATGPQLAHLGTGLSSATGEQLLLAFLDRWLDKLDSIGTPAARKLSALALCNVLTLPVTPILDRLDPIAAHLTSVWFEIEGTDAADGHSLGAEYYTTPRSEVDNEVTAATAASEEAEAEIKRRQLLQEHDVVNQLKLSSFAKEKMQQAIQMHGHRFEQAMQSIDSTISKQLQRMLAG
ncbi:hypothetical protein WJX77_002150 [Trebouxia sp. C0004]